jgi:hypothetical protein
MIDELETQRAHITAAIAALNLLRKPPAVAGEAEPRRRGRKAMGPAERAEVSARMRRYWARRRKGAAA